MVYSQGARVFVAPRFGLVVHALFACGVMIPTSRGFGVQRESIDYYDPPSFREASPSCGLDSAG